LKKGIEDGKTSPHSGFAELIFLNGHMFNSDAQIQYNPIQNPNDVLHRNF
jgi:hypothetical protein